MSKTSRPRLSDIRHAFRLLGDVRDLRADPDQQYRVLADGLCRLVGADNGFACVFVDFVPTGALQMVRLVQSSERDPQLLRWFAELPSPHADPMIEHAVTLPGRARVTTQQAFYSPDLHEAYPYFFETIPRYRLADNLVGLFRRRDPRDITGFALHRRGGPLYRPREVGLAQLVVRELRHLYVKNLLEPIDPATQLLTPREHQVYLSVLRGSAPKEIAATLGLSVHTVRDHLKRIYERMQVNSRHELLSRHIAQPGGGATEKRGPAEPGGGES